MELYYYWFLFTTLVLLLMDTQIKNKSVKKLESSKMEKSKSKASQKSSPIKKEKKTNITRNMAGTNWINNNVTKISSNCKKKHYSKKITETIAIDCEMVGTGLNGEKSLLARVSIVNEYGDIILDKYVKPLEKVTDYRTKISGIRPRDIINGADFTDVQNQVRNIIHNKTIVGHALHHDLEVLLLKHPCKYIRDTAKYSPLAKQISNGLTPSLKLLAKVLLGKDIQTGEHSSVEDARTAMEIYKKLKIDWEKYIKKLNQQYRNSRYR